jgi:hypothetical protein
MKKLLAAALIAAPLLASANLVQNGSFESVAGTLSNGAWSRYSTSTSGGWTVEATNQLEFRNNVAGAAYDGKIFAELDVDRNARISQTLATTAGQWYELSFAYSNRSGVAVDSNGLIWNFGNTTQQASTLALNNSGGNAWTVFSTKVLATDSSTTLSFAAVGTSDGYGTSLDNISVTTAVPEPETYALMMAGLGVIGAIARRRTKQQ